MTIIKDTLMFGAIMLFFIPFLVLGVASAFKLYLYPESNNEGCKIYRNAR